MNMDHLRSEWSNCERCPLYELRTNIVFGSGNPEADILLIGEAPGEEEDLKGVPFVGSSGKVLDEFLRAVDLDRHTDLFITNVVCCRPSQLIEKASKKGNFRKENRQPTMGEVGACRPRLLEIIYLVDPFVIITMGRVASRALLKTTAPMQSIRGRIMTTEIPGRYTTIRYPVLPMWHPAYLLRNPSKAPASPWGLTAQDFVETRDIRDYLRKAYRGEEPFSSTFEENEY
jgi:DNA polymerase